MQSFENDPALDRVKVIACDMDLTLLHDDKSMPEGMVERITALADAGVVFAPASGRPAATLSMMFPGCEGVCGVIADNGGMVEYAGKTVYKSLMDPALYQEILARAVEVGGCAPVLCALHEAYVLARDYDQHEALSIYYKTINYVDTFEGLDVEADKVSLLFPNWDSKAAYDKIWAPEFGDRLYVTCAGNDWVDFMNKGVSKGTGLAHLCEHLGVDIADAAALGDTYNDIEMLKVAGHSCLVANAEEHMQQYASWQLPSNNDDGVPAYLDAVLAAKRG